MDRKAVSIAGFASQHHESEGDFPSSAAACGGSQESTEHWGPNRTFGSIVVDGGSILHDF